MGVIKRQGIKQSMVNYSAVFIAALSTIFIYSLDPDVYGFARFIIDTAFFLVPIMLVGFGSVATKYYPFFKADSENGSRFLGLMLLVVATASCVVLLVLYFFKDDFFSILSHHPDHYKKQFFKIGLLGFIITIFRLLVHYTSNFKRIVVPSIFNNFIKLSLPLLILSVVIYKQPINFLTNGIIITYSIALVSIIIYLISLGKFKINFNIGFLGKARSKEMTSFAMYSLFAGIGSMLAFRIDSIMVSTLIDFKSNGVYTISSFIGNVIAIPTMAIQSIASPILAESFSKDSIDEVTQIYKKSSINLLLFGLLLFILIALSIDDLFLLMPRKNFDFKIAAYIVLIIGATKLVDMATSVNSQIISYSKFYRFNLVAVLLLAILNIALNLILIPKYQIIGAAAATFLSLLIFNLVKLFFIYLKFKILPFTKATVYAMTLALFCFAMGYFIPDTSFPLLNIIIKSIIVALIYIGLMYYTNISSDMNDLLKSGLSKLRST